MQKLEDLVKMQERQALLLKMHRLAVAPAETTAEDDGPWEPEPDEKWTCVKCTVVNECLFLQCQACGTERPEDI